jgi:hypothetical protein
VIGAGVRLPLNRLVLFEAVVNAIHRVAPQAAIAFNTRPEDCGEALRVDHQKSLPSTSVAQRRAERQRLAVERGSQSRARTDVRARLAADLSVREVQVAD